MAATGRTTPARRRAACAVSPFAFAAATIDLTSSGSSGVASARFSGLRVLGRFVAGFSSRSMAPTASTKSNGSPDGVLARAPATIRSITSGPIPRLASAPRSSADVSSGCGGDGCEDLKGCARTSWPNTNRADDSDVYVLAEVLEIPVW